uniref:Uncharacterized protein n=1 Tax=Arion vulgaris TaxID=1028688 RepID=A0A0B7BEI6_9EUPU
MAAMASQQAVQGLCEAEISCCGHEVDLYRHLGSCKKNPGHKMFTPLDKFTVIDLPASYRDNNIVNLIKALSDLTVRVDVKYTSFQRPDICPEHNKPYPCSNLKGRNTLRNGSGWVWQVKIYSKKIYKSKSCPCHECQGSSNPALTWAVIEICTAIHVVYDEIEGEHTTCRFFYDKNDTAIGGLPTVFRATRVVKDVNGSDKCTMTFITHNIDFGNMLKNKLRLYKTLHTEVGEKYNSRKQDSQIEDTEDDHKLTIIVSHPHGCSKQISIGYYVSRHEMKNNDVYVVYTYTTATCTGSSGAPVYVLSRWWWWGCDHPHKGHCADNEELNYSGIAMY